MSNQTQHVVVWDPEGQYWEGALVRPEVAETVRQRGGCSLPASPETFRLSGVGGFFKRAWGAGWPLDFAFPQMSCPLTVFIPEGYRGMYWAIRLQASSDILERAMKGEPVAQGTVRIVADSTQAFALKAAVTPVGRAEDGNAAQGSSLGKADALGGWILTGRCIVNPPQPGHCGFGVYGTMPGVRVAWAALSVVPTVQ